MNARAFPLTPLIIRRRKKVDRNFSGSSTKRGGNFHMWDALFQISLLNLGRDGRHVGDQFCSRKGKAHSVGR
jgi:hypothetical protein